MNWSMFFSVERDVNKGLALVLSQVCMYRKHSAKVGRTRKCRFNSDDQVGVQRKCGQANLPLIKLGPLWWLMRMGIGNSSRRSHINSF